MYGIQKRKKKVKSFGNDASDKTIFSGKADDGVQCDNNNSESGNV